MPARLASVRSRLLQLGRALPGVVRRSIPGPLQRGIRWALGDEASASYRIIGEGEALKHASPAWFDPAVVARQHEAYQRLLADMRAGRPRVDLTSLGAALRCTGLVRPVLLEVGCGSGYLHEVIEHLMGPVRYLGVDRSPAMLGRGRREYPSLGLALGDATALPFASRSVDVVLNGAALMHTVRWRLAVEEAARVSRGWGIFHTVPLLRRRPTTFLEKRAYGRPTVEVILNEEELLGQLAAAGLHVRSRLPGIPYVIGPLLGEPTVTVTLVCELRS